MKKNKSDDTRELRFDWFRQATAFLNLPEEVINILAQYSLGVVLYE